MKKYLFLLIIGLTFGQAVTAQSKGKILVLLSSEQDMQLAEGRVIKTGYYLNEFGVPAMALSDAGYQLVLATPKGNAPKVDNKSVDVQYFSGSEAELLKTQQFIAGLPDINDTLSLKEVLNAGLDGYKGLFIPGGHAPLIDLADNPGVGQILHHFNKNKKPTAAICHGPIALLSAQINPAGYMNSLEQGTKASASNWIYQGYQMTIFSTPEEQVFESSLEGAKLLYYPAFAMQQAGALGQFAESWQPHVVTDRELVTGQNPFSDHQLAAAFISLLDKTYPNN